MPKLEPHERLAIARRKAGYGTATDAARAFGWNENTYRSHENGERGLKRSVAERYARAFRTSAAYILFAEDSEDVEENNDPLALNGFINEDGRSFLKRFPKPAEIEFVASFYDIELKFNKYPILLEFNGYYHFGAYHPGDLAIFENRKKQFTLGNLKDYWGRPCLIETTDGEFFFRRARAGSEPGYIDIEITPGRPAHNIAPRWIGLMIVAIPHGQWTKRTMQEWVQGWLDDE